MRPTDPAALRGLKRRLDRPAADAPTHLRGPRPANPRLATWLAARGSLSARLLRAFGGLAVTRLTQGLQPAWTGEHALLGVRPSMPLHAREVILYGGELPRVFARSVTTQRASRGPWRALRGLGQRPLAERLYMRRDITRSELRAKRLTRSEVRHVHTAWVALTGQAPPVLWWRRHSVFRYRGAPLLVCEYFPLIANTWPTP